MNLKTNKNKSLKYIAFSNLLLLLQYYCFQENGKLEPTIIRQKLTGGLEDINVILLYDH